MAEKYGCAAAPENGYLVEVRNLVKRYPARTGLPGRAPDIRAVDGVSFKIRRGGTMGLVGESGCGKTTLGRAVLRLIDKTSGEVRFDGADLYALSGEELRKLRPRMQMIFQDPYSSLSPRMPVGALIGEAVREHGIVPRGEYDDYIARVMRVCGLRASCRNRYPHEFSGGERQRIGIARALATNPDFIVCDEPVSALDMSVQAQIMNLLMQLQKDFGLTYLFISHDLTVVRHISDTVGVMYLGAMAELAGTEELFANPLHPYTGTLFASMPAARPGAETDRAIPAGGLPAPAGTPRGCRFYARCAERTDVCSVSAPGYAEVSPGHWCACHLYDGVRAK